MLPTGQIICDLKYGYRDFLFERSSTKVYARALAKIWRLIDHRFIHTTRSTQGFSIQHLSIWSY
jgi:hypothetical protein